VPTSRPNIFFTVYKHGLYIIAGQTGILPLPRDIDVGELIFLQINEVDPTSVQSYQKIPIRILGYGRNRTYLQGIGIVVITGYVVKFIVQLIIYGHPFIIITHPDLIVIIQIEGPDGVGQDTAFIVFTGYVMI